MIRAYQKEINRYTDTLTSSQIHHPGSVPTLEEIRRLIDRSATKTTS